MPGMDAENHCVPVRNGHTARAKGCNVVKKRLEPAKRLFTNDGWQAVEAGLFEHVEVQIAMFRRPPHSKSVNSSVRCPHFSSKDAIPDEHRKERLRQGPA